MTNKYNTYKGFHSLLVLLHLLQIILFLFFGRRNIPSYSFMVLLSSPLFTLAAENSAAKLVQTYLQRKTVCRWWVSGNVCAAQHWNPLCNQSNQIINPNVIMSWIFFCMFSGGFFLSPRCGSQDIELKDNSLVSEKPVSLLTDNKILPFTPCSDISFLFLCLRKFLKSKYSGWKRIISFDFHRKVILPNSVSQGHRGKMKTQILKYDFAQIFFLSNCVSNIILFWTLRFMVQIQTWIKRFLCYSFASLSDANFKNITKFIFSVHLSASS